VFAWPACTENRKEVVNMNGLAPLTCMRKVKAEELEELLALYCFLNPNVPPLRSTQTWKAIGTAI